MLSSAAVPYAFIDDAGHELVAWNDFGNRTKRLGLACADDLLGEHRRPAANRPNDLLPQRMHAVPWQDAEI